MPLPICSLHPNFRMERALGPYAFLELGHIGCSVIGVHQRLPAVASGLLGTHIEEFAEGAIDELLVAPRIVYPYHQWQPVGHGPEPGLALAQRLLVAVPLRQVIKVADDARPPVGKRDPLDLPVVGLAPGITPATQDRRWCVVGLAGCEGMAKTGDQLAGEGFRP